MLLKILFSKDVKQWTFGLGSKHQWKRAGNLGKDAASKQAFSLLLFVTVACFTYVCCSFSLFLCKDSLQITFTNFSSISITQGVQSKKNCRLSLQPKGADMWRRLATAWIKQAEAPSLTEPHLYPFRHMQVSKDAKGYLPTHTCLPKPGVPLLILCRMWLQKASHEDKAPIFSKTLLTSEWDVGFHSGLGPLLKFLC